MRLPFLMLLTCLIPGLILVSAPDARALQEKTTCQCMEAPLKRRWESARAVFTGTVTEIEIVKEWVARGNDDLPVIVTVTVDEPFKGVEKGNIFRFHSSLHKDTCMGADYETGKAFLFFAYEREERIYEKWSLYDFDTGTFDVGGLCGGTKKMDDALTAPEIAEIGKLSTDAPLLKPSKEGIIGLPPDKNTGQPAE
jgi:hypothetical protein